MDRRRDGELLIRVQWACPGEVRARWSRRGWWVGPGGAWQEWRWRGAHGGEMEDTAMPCAAPRRCHGGGVEVEARGGGVPVVEGGDGGVAVVA